MAIVYQKIPEDMTVIVSPREQGVRQFDFGDEWTEIRIGMYFNTVTAAGDNTTSVGENVVVNNVLDRFSFGIKDNSQAAPGQTGSVFIGVSNGTGENSQLQQNFAQRIIKNSAAGGVNVVGFNGTTLVYPSSTTVTNIIDGDCSPTTNYASFYSIKYVLANRGLSTQTMAVSVSSAVNVATGTDFYSTAQLRSQVLSATYGSAITLNWNNGSTAYDIPDSWFIRNPFFNNRIRLSCMNAIKVLP